MSYITEDSFQYLPLEWGNDERMRVLMGPMPQITDNTAYQCRLVFWQKNLYEWMLHKKGLSFSFKEAQLAFRRGTLIPQCLEQVLHHLIKQGEILTYEEFQSKIIDSESWFSWGNRVLIATPSKWAWRKAKDTVGLNKKINSTFINLSVVQEIAELILSNYWSRDTVNDIFTIQSFYKFSKSVVDKLLLVDMDIILQQFSINNRISIKIHQDQTYIKFIKPNQVGDSPIEDSEIAEFEIRKTELRLQERMTFLQHEISPLRDEAKDLMRNGLKRQALSKLRRRKQLEKSLDVTLSSYENVSSCLRQLQDSQMNKDILKSFQLGVNALKSSLTEMGSADDVSETMISLQDILEECNDISDTLSTDIQGHKDIDDISLEKELEDLVHLSLEESRTDMDFPPVPVNNPLDITQSSLDAELENSLIS